MKISLSVLERLLVLNLLPAESNIVTLRTVRKTKDLVGFTDEEQIALGFHSEGNQVKWKPDVVGDVELDFGEKAADIIIEALKELNKSKKLTENHLSIYDKFVGDSV